MKEFWIKFALFVLYVLALLGLEFLAEVAAITIPKWKVKRKNTLRPELPHRPPIQKARASRTRSPSKGPYEHPTENL